VVTLVRRIRNLTAAVFAAFAASAAIAQAAGAASWLRLTLAFVGGAAAVVALVLLLIEQQAERGEEAAGRAKAALELLGETNARVGAMHLLERVVGDAPRTYHRTMVETLTAYVQTAAPWPPTDVSENARRRLPKLRPPPDVQAALDVLGRRDPRLDGDRILLRLSDVDLRGASLRGGHFEGVRLRRAHLEGASLEGAQLQGAKLRDAHFERADFSPDPEEGLDGANLEGANVEGTNFDGANLEGARLEKATYSSTTRWPDGFDPQAAEAVVATSPDVEERRQRNL
jgi:Pentapeptide repeats (8 copies)